MNQREEVAAVAIGPNIYMATPPGKRQKCSNKPFADKKRPHYSKEQLDIIHQGYEEQLAGVGRRGAQTRNWENVSQGEELRPVVKGPYNVCDACTRTMASCCPYRRGGSR